ncbi:MAG: hypothetical protein V7K89_30115 [Nostoc sp.]|uniref:hypothetical protein n=1 Tax=Nostoc sp. TaxID=1180 RepID=UPI002FF8E4E0
MDGSPTAVTILHPTENRYNTQNLLVRDGAYVDASIYGTGKGGSLTVTAKDVQVIGTSTDGRFRSGMFTQAYLGITGDGGNLTINTQRLLVRNGAQVDAETYGTGKGGFLNVTAKDVQLIGTSSNGYFPSGLLTSTHSTGDAGNLKIDTQQLLVRDGALINASTSGAGKGGSLTVTANDVQLIGTSSDGRFGSSLLASTDSTGDAGGLKISNDNLLVQDGAIVSVSSSGKGIAGNLNIDSASIRLNNNATVNANTQAVNTDLSKEQATITLHSEDLLLLRNSNITTNASGENVIGGNININTDILVAFDNSDISANSTDFRGGQVIINAKGVFGTQFRDVPTPNSDITATGANQQLNGTVQLNTL